MPSLRFRPAPKILLAQFYIKNFAVGKLVQIRKSPSGKSKLEAIVDFIEIDGLARGADTNDDRNTPYTCVFPDLATKNVGSSGGLSQTFSSIMEEPCVHRGKTSKVKAPGVERITYERGFHSLRNEFRRWLRVVASVSEEDGITLMVHRKTKTHSKYSATDYNLSRNDISNAPNNHIKNKIYNKDL